MTFIILRTKKASVLKNIDEDGNIEYKIPLITVQESLKVSLPVSLFYLLFWRNVSLMSPLFSSHLFIGSCYEVHSIFLFIAQHADCCTDLMLVPCMQAELTPGSYMQGGSDKTCCSQHTVLCKKKRDA